jgi:hypothetical protein
MGIKEDKLNLEIWETKQEIIALGEYLAAYEVIDFHLMDNATDEFMSKCDVYIKLLDKQDELLGKLIVLGNE